MRFPGANSSGGQQKHGTLRTNREFAPGDAAGKVPVPSGQRLQLGDRKALILEPTAKHLWSFLVPWLCLLHSHALSICKNAN